MNFEMPLKLIDQCICEGQSREHSRMKKLAIIPFQSWKGNHYIYDDCTGAILPSSRLMESALWAYKDKPMEDVIQELSSLYEFEEVQSACSFIKTWVDSFSAFYRKPEWEPDLFPHLYDFPQDDIKRFAESSLMQLVLLLTESCNLRCRYCIYSDLYPDTRTYTSIKMSFETACQAVDYFFSLVKPLVRRNPAKKVGITFYGGEPLLEINLLRKLVPYIIKNAPCEVIFNLTTNATLLNQETIDFLIENNFGIALSIDGPQEEHDRNRVFPNGKGSFTIAWKNIQALKRRKIDPTRLLFVSVYDWRTDLQAASQFFLHHIGRMAVGGFVNSVSEVGTDYYKQFTHDDYEKYCQQKSLLWKEYLQYLMHEKPISPYTKSLFDLAIIGIYFRPRLNDVRFPPFPVGSCCVPGMKMAVRPDGKIDICERVNGTFPIGHLETGLNFDRIEELIHKYNNKVTENCFNCPMTRLCNLCFALSNTNGSFEIPTGYCESMRKTFLDHLEAYCSILEEKNNAFERFDTAMLEKWMLNK